MALIVASLVILAICAVAPSGRVSAQEPEAGKEPFSAIFVKTDAMIPMRDGVKLHTEIYSPKGAPKNAAEKLPLFITRTPYGTSDDDAGYSQLLGLYREMFADGYIFVMQDIRGRYGSEGKFLMGRAPRDLRDSKSIDEGTDTLRHDRMAVEKRAEQQWARGRGGNFVWRMADGYVADRAAPGAEGGV